MRAYNLEVYSHNDVGIYRGINKTYFPKWKGWSLEGDEKEDAVDKFYEVYFYYNMKLDQIKDQTLVLLIMNMATLHGKKKAISKLQKVLGLEMTGLSSSYLMVKAHEESEVILYKYMLEIMEFYSFIRDPEASAWVLNTYRHL